MEAIMEKREEPTKNWELDNGKVATDFDKILIQLSIATNRILETAPKIVYHFPN
jgi:hypothetical protein